MNLVTCPLCCAPSMYAFRKHGYRIYDCRSCAHRFVGDSITPEHVDAVYGDDYFSGGGAGYPDYLAEAALLRSSGRWYGRLLKRWGKPGQILDVGAAAGFLLCGMLDEGWQGTGIEPNARMAEYGKQHLGVNIEVGTLESMTLTGPFDAVSLIQVIAHFYDLPRAFASIRRGLRPNGLLLIETWNRASWTARLTGTNWHEYSPPSVLHWFSRRSLATFLQTQGFRLLAQGMRLKWISFAHAQSLLAHTQEQSLVGSLAGSILKRMPGRWAVPYPSEDLFWAVYRKES